MNVCSTVIVLFLLITIQRTEAGTLERFNQSEENNQTSLETTTNVYNGTTTTSRGIFWRVMDHLYEERPYLTTRTTNAKRSTTPTIMTTVAPQMYTEMLVEVTTLVLIPIGLIATACLLLAILVVLKCVSVFCPRCGKDQPNQQVEEVTVRHQATDSTDLYTQLTQTTV